MTEIELVCPACQNIGATSGQLKRQKCFYNLGKDLWHCFQCNASGKGDPRGEGPMCLPMVSPPRELFDFSPSLLEIYQLELLNCEDAKNYVRQRLGADVVEKNLFGLGFDPGRGMIVIPVFDLNNHLVGVKYRSIHAQPLSGPRYLSEPGSSSGLYVLHAHATDASKILIVEGEFDAMSAALLGYSGVVVATQTNRLNVKASERLLALMDKKIKKIHVSLDHDEAGSELLRSLRSNLSIDESRICEIVLPSEFKDLNEMLEKLGVGEARLRFSSALEAAKLPMEEASFSVFDRLPETLNFLSDKKNTTGISTGIKKLDERLGGGFLPYTLTALSAPGKTGKTTFLIQIIHNLIHRQKQVGFISLEMSPTTHVIPSLLSIATGKNVRRLLVEQMAGLFEKFKSESSYLNNLSFFDRYGCTSAEEISDWVKYQYECKQVTIFFLDHVGYSLKDIKDVAEHSKLSKSLRALTREFPIHIIAVVQPKQLPFGQKQITKHDLYGSVTWSQDINQLLTLERSGDNQVSLRLTDSHSPLARPSDEAVLLFYDPETCKLSD